MKLWDLLLTASSNMLRSKARAFLTVIAVFIGAMTITLTNGIGTGIKSYLGRQLGNLGASNVLTVRLTNKNASANFLGNATPVKYDPSKRTNKAGRGPDAQQLLMSTKDLTAIKAVSNIISVQAEHALQPDYVAASGGKYLLSLQEQFGVATVDTVVGSGVNNDSDQYQITIPVSFVKALGFRDNMAAVGQAVTFGMTDATGKRHTVLATVVGVQQKTLIGSMTAYANSTLADRLFTLQSIGLPRLTADSFTTATATFPTGLSASRIAMLKDALSAKGYTAQTIQDQEKSLFTTINVVIVVFDIFGAIALLAASFGIINTLFMAVQERTKEIGLMKALGMSGNRIFLLFSIEAILIGFWGSILGILVASLIGKTVNTVGANGFLKDFPGLSLLTFPLGAISAIGIGIMLIAFIAGTLPALRASRKDPIQALRYE